MINLAPPITDPDLPSYIHPELERVWGDIKMAGDCWELLKDSKSEYLPPEAAEPPDAYKARLQRAEYANFFQAAIDGYAGLLTRYELHNAPPTFEGVKDNLDRRGNDHFTLFNTSDQQTLRDGGYYLLVDMPSGKVDSRAEELAEKRTPYVTRIPRTNVLNWVSRFDEGEEIIEQVTILEWKEERKGLFGIECTPRYRVITGGQWQLLKLVKPKNSRKWVVEVETSGTYEQPNGQPLETCPLVWYPAQETAAFGCGDPPLMAIVRHNLEHFRLRSDQSELLHKLAMPVPVRTGHTPEKDSLGNPVPTVIGPNSIIDLQNGGTFKFEEPGGSSLSARAEQIAHVERLINQQTLAFLLDGGESQNKTATQASLEASQVQATINSLTRAKNNIAQRLMQIWCLFTGETLQADAGIVMAPGLFDLPLDTDMVKTLIELYNNDLASRRSVIEQVIRGGVLSVVSDVEKELERIDEEKRVEKARVRVLPVSPNEMEGNRFLPSSTDAPPPVDVEDADAAA